MKKLYFTVLFIFFCNPLFSQNKIVLIHASNPHHGKIYLLKKINESYFVTEVFNCLFGAKGIDKRELHDQKTPLGHYRISKKVKVKVNNPSNDVKFGGYFLEINYPNYCNNPTDKSRGGSIGIHGGNTNNTLGCIRILDSHRWSNHVNYINIEKVANFVSEGTTVLISEFIPNALIRNKNEFIPPEAFYFLQYLLNTERCYCEVIDLMKNYESPTKNVGVVNDMDFIISKKEDTYITHYTIRSGTHFLYYDYDDTWYYIMTLDKKTGFIPQNSIAIKVILYNCTGIATTKDRDGYTNIRSKKNAKSEKKGTVNSNELFWYSTNDDNWLSIVTKNGTNGYIYKPLVKSKS